MFLAAPRRTDKSTFVRQDDVRRPGLFSAAMKARLLARLETEMGAAHGVSVETPSVQNALDKLREESFLWRSHYGSYSVENEQFLEWLVEEDRDSNDIQCPSMVLMRLRRGHLYDTS